jgi:dihydrofolate reductase
MKKKNRMQIAIIAAMAKNRVIGKSGKIPWRLPDDLKRFRDITMGHAIIMGRKTYETFGKPLIGRLNVVITRRENYQPKVSAICKIVHSLTEAFKEAELTNKDRAFVIGGAEIFEQALPFADEMYLTFVDGEFEGDSYFPEFDSRLWLVVRTEEFKANQENPHPSRFVIFQRIK